MLVAGKENDNEKFDFLNENTRNPPNGYNQGYKKNSEEDKFAPKTFPDYLRKHLKGKFAKFVQTSEYIVITYDRLSEQFIAVLKDNYERLLNMYNDMSNKCLTDSHKKKFSSLLVFISFYQLII